MAGAESVRLLPLNTVCERLSVSRDFLYDERSRGRLRFTKLGRRSFVSTSELERYLNEGERNPAPSGGWPAP